MPSPLLLQRLSKFLQNSRASLVTDCEGLLQTGDLSYDPALPAFSWREQLDGMLEELAGQLEATAAGEGWNIDGVLSEEGGPEGAAIQSLLLEASVVRNFFLRTLNRFQATQAGQGGFTATEMTEIRQDTQDMFERLVTAALARWISQMKLDGGSGAGEEGSGSPASAGNREAPAILTPNESTAATVEEIREGLRAVSTQFGRMRVLLPGGRDNPATLAMHELQRMSSLLESLGVPGPPRPEPARQDPIRLAPLAVRSFVEALGDAFRPLAEQKGLRFAVNVEASLQNVDTDAPKLHRAASLLIGNAVQYTLTGGVSVTARASTGDWMLTIEDTGPGIEPGKLARLLTGGGRGKDRMPHGLAVTRELVQLLGGHLDADSILRRGSRFTICLPRSRRASG